jgi:hypothetical protein
VSTDLARYSATVTVEALPDDVPAAVRVRRWIKQALRSFRLKVTDISPPPHGLPVGLPTSCTLSTRSVRSPCPQGPQDAPGDATGGEPDHGPPAG